MVEESSVPSLLLANAQQGSPPSLKQPQKLSLSTPPKDASTTLAHSPMTLLQQEKQGIAGDYSTATQKKPAGMSAALPKIPKLAIELVPPYWSPSMKKAPPIINALGQIVIKKQKQVESVKRPSSAVQKRVTGNALVTKPLYEQSKPLIRSQTKPLRSQVISTEQGNKETQQVVSKNNIIRNRPVSAPPGRPAKQNIATKPIAANIAPTPNSQQNQKIEAAKARPRPTTATLKQGQTISKTTVVAATVSKRELQPSSSAKPRPSTPIQKQKIGETLTRPSSALSKQRTSASYTPSPDMIAVRNTILFKPDIFPHVAGFLSLSEIYATKLTCKTLYKLVNDGMSGWALSTYKYIESELAMLVTLEQLYTNNRQMYLNHGFNSVTAYGLPTKPQLDTLITLSKPSLETELVAELFLTLFQRPIAKQRHLLWPSFVSLIKARGMAYMTNLRKDLIPVRTLDTLARYRAKYHRLLNHEHLNRIHAASASIARYVFGIARAADIDGCHHVTREKAKKQRIKQHLEQFTKRSN